MSELTFFLITSLSDVIMGHSSVEFYGFSRSCKVDRLDSSEILGLKPSRRSIILLFRVLLPLISFCSNTSKSLSNSSKSGGDKVFCNPFFY